MLNTTVHREVMLRILKEIYSDISLGPLLGFKGGTDMYLLHGLPRFSVDLDFDLLDVSKKDIVFTKISKIAGKIAEVRQAREKFYNLFWLVSYEKRAPQIKIEISKRSFPSSFEVKHYLGIPMLSMKKEDMFANKLLALLTRREIACRDIYDIWFMLDGNWDINWDVAKFRTKLGLKTYLRKCLDLLEKKPPKSILRGLGELLNNKTKVWVRENLLKETIFLLKLKLKTLATRDGH